LKHTWPEHAGYDDLVKALKQMTVHIYWGGERWDNR